MIDLYRISIDVIRANQNNSGAYIASPAFSNYQFCWLRDGSYIAYAMDRAGEADSAAAFFRWVNKTINRYAYKVKRFERELGETSLRKSFSILHTRYTMDGEEEGSDSEWGNFQIDGYGSWLWALNQHIQITGNHTLLQEFHDSITTTADYLRFVWKLPNYDCWEEHPEYIHPYSLAAVYGGLLAVQDMVSAGLKWDCEFQLDGLINEIKDYIYKYGVDEGRFVKHISPAANGNDLFPLYMTGVDASLLGMSVPYRVAGLSEQVMENTLVALEQDLLRNGGGVYRYKADTYYGGGEWLLLAGWLGWTYAQSGQKDNAVELKRWIESCADQNGFLPEQVNEHLLAPEQYQPWVERWGNVAKPLLWSHAMYIILCQEISMLN